MIISFLSKVVTFISGVCMCVHTYHFILLAGISKIVLNNSDYSEYSNFVLFNILFDVNEGF